MERELKIDKRRSIRLKGYDYSATGAYFVTLCTHKKEPLFGRVIDGTMQMDNLGHIVEYEWLRSKAIRAEIELDAFMVMPNHFHAIVCIFDNGTSINPVGATGGSPAIGGSVTMGGSATVGATGGSPINPCGPKPKSLSSLIAGFKSASAKRINEIRQLPGVPVWQRNYYEHVVRDEESLDKIREYISNNPLTWSLDRENPEREAEDPFEIWMETFRELRDKVQSERAGTRR